MDHNDLKDYIFDFAFNEALVDATRRTGAAGCKEKVLNSEAKRIIKDYADAVLRGENPCFYGTATEVENSINEEKFTFGNTQKLLNMTIKYMYIACYNDERLRKLYASCHCPMDRRMKEKVIKQYKEETKGNKELEAVLEYKCEDGTRSKDWEKVSWSKITKTLVSKYPEENPYTRFQKMVLYLAKKEGLSPLEYDFKEFSSTNTNA